MSEKTELEEVLKHIYDSYVLPPIVSSQLKSYTQSGMTYRGLLNTLNYVLDNLNITFELKYGIGLLKYYYYTQHNYYKKAIKHTYHVVDQRVNIKAPHHDKNKKNLIDMENIDGD